MPSKTAVLAAVSAVALLVSAGAAPVAASTHQPSFVVALQDDGDATVTVTYTYDLDSDAEQAAFEELQTNDTATAAFEQRFEERLSAVAATTANVTGRTMSVGNASLELTTESGTGVATLSIPWTNLAATTDEGLVLTEPFASEFTPDRQFVVTLPAGYEATSVTPQPDDTSDGRLVWNADTSLDGFELVTAPETTATDSATQTDTEASTTAAGDEPTTSSESGPGFGIGVALVALLSLAVLALGRL